jgi:hypothetical protein
MIKTFNSYLDKKQRDSIKHLSIIQKVLEHNGMKVENFLDSEKNDEPYIFCFNPTKNTSFDGLRIYGIGGSYCFRIQKENKTHPYGKAYPLQVEEMFHGLLGDKDVDRKKAGEQVIELVGKEVKRFFDKSEAAEKIDRQTDASGNLSAGSVLVKTNGTDYSSLIYK